MNGINEKYFEWLYNKVINNKMQKNMSYRRLLQFLHSVDFSYTIPRDGNRFGDGINLRYRFGMEKHIDDRIIAQKLDIYPCSVLEMMVALANRIETQIMTNTEAGDRTFTWFFEMLSSLGLSQMQDPYFDEQKAAKICERFLNREYDQNGKGGLFTIYHRDTDMRTVEIWYQAMWYLSELEGI